MTSGLWKPPPLKGFPSVTEAALNAGGAVWIRSRCARTFVGAVYLTSKIEKYWSEND